jgi:hypothetical protein
MRLLPRPPAAPSRRCVAYLCPCRCPCPLPRRRPRAALVHTGSGLDRPVHPLRVLREGVRDDAGCVQLPCWRRGQPGHVDPYRLIRMHMRGGV